jgi:hypothetical protein
METDTISSSSEVSTLGDIRRFYEEMISMFIRDNENALGSREMHFVASLARKIELVGELRRFRSLITRKKRAVTSRDGTTERKFRGLRLIRVDDIER